MNALRPAPALPSMPNQIIAYVDTELPRPAPSAAEAPKTSHDEKATAEAPRRDARLWIVAALAALQAFAAVATFGGGVAAEYAQRTGRFFVPGLGITLFTLLTLALVLLVLGRKARFNRATIGLLSATALLAVVPLVVASDVLVILDTMILLGTSTLAICQLAGLDELAWDTFAAIRAACARFFGNLFAHVLEPLRALRSGEVRASAPATRRALVGLACAAGLALVVLPLLTSADAMFGARVDGIVDALFAHGVPWEAIANVARFAAVAPLLFSLLWTLAIPREAVRGQICPRAPFTRADDVPLLVTLGAADIIYLVFCTYQVVYLFAGIGPVEEAGGYAAYARTGFFQLVVVAAINLALVLVASMPSEAGRAQRLATRVLALALVALTAVILVSACWRMNLYVEAYGLSLLRALTYLGMALIAVLLAAGAARVLKGSFPFFRVVIVAGLGLWLAFCMAVPDAFIARHNVDRFLEGSLASVDVWYLSSLSPNTLGALDDLLESGKKVPDLSGEGLKEAIGQTAHERDARLSTWQTYNLACALAK